MRNTVRHHRVFTVPNASMKQPDLTEHGAVRAQLRNITRGIEKESLRINEQGRLSQSPHPPCLGAALTNPYITTDYSEALLEFITPTYTSVSGVLQSLDDSHRYTYGCLGHELLWTASMPCILRGDADIPVAQYGDSNIGRMKTIYRLGLGHRYGRAMQAIAGIHYNFSLPDAFWHAYRQALGDDGSLQAFKNRHYLGLIRNFRRNSWLLSYLFGASPALCSSFLDGSSHKLQAFNSNTLYLPNATSLRMGRLGYQSSAQEDIVVCYNTLDSYMDSLRALLTQEHAQYQALGTHDDSGNRVQLSTSMLQIENEFYSSIRPKQIARSTEAPLLALARRGVEYVEVRALDLNPYLPLGIDAAQIRFLDLFLLNCLFQPSPPLTPGEYHQSQRNLARVVDGGRAHDLKLEYNGEHRPLRRWAASILAELDAIAGLMDDCADDYRSALQQQRHKLADSALTPSGRIIAQMRERDMPWFHLAMQQSQAHADYFRQRPLDGDGQAFYRQAASDSLAEQRRIEEASSLPFERFLQDYYRQYQA